MYLIQKARRIEARRIVASPLSIGLSAIGIVVMIIIISRVSSIYARQESFDIARQFDQYKPSEIIELEGESGRTTNATFAKDALLSCTHALIQFKEAGGYAIAISNNILGFCHFSMIGGIESPIYRSCWAYLPRYQKWQSADYDFYSILGDIASCKSLFG